MRWLLLGQFVNATGSLMWLLLTLYLVQVRDLSLTTAGLVVGANGVGTILGNLTGGSLGDRFGMRRASLAALAVSAVTCAAVPVVGPAWALAALVAVRGLAGGATRPLLSATIASELPADRRREGVALSRSVLNAGTVIGPPLGALLSGQAFGAVFLVDGVTTLLLCLLIYRFVPVDDVTHARTASRAAGTLWAALRRDERLRRMLLGIVAVDTTYRLMYTVLPVQLAEQGVSTLAYGLLVSLNCIVIVAAEAPIALALRDRPAVTVIAGGFVLVGVAYLVLGISPGLVLAVVAMVILTVGEMLYKPTATAHAADLAPPGMAGRYQSAYGAASISGTMLSPVVGGAVYDVAPGLVWPLAGAVAVLAGVLLYVSSVKDRATPATLAA
jgi:MFS family permease